LSGERKEKLVIGKEQTNGYLSPWFPGQEHRDCLVPLVKIENPTGIVSNMIEMQ
jgi:hypothetical protein